MVYCPDCGNPVSFNAAVCPHCGRPFVQNSPEKKSSGGGILGAIFAIILIVLFVIFVLPEIIGFFYGFNVGIHLFK